MTTLPRDDSGDRLIRQLRRLGYEPTRQRNEEQLRTAKTKHPRGL
jgi:hypothetical protein